MKTSSDNTTGKRLLALRKALKMAAHKVAAASGGRLTRTDISKAENGQNDATTDRWRAGLATAFNLSRDDLADYIDGRLPLEDALKRAQLGPRGGESDTTRSADGPLPPELEELLEEDPALPHAGVAYAKSYFFMNKARLPKPTWRSLIVEHVAELRGKAVSRRAPELLDDLEAEQLAIGAARKGARAKKSDPKNKK